MKPIGALGFLNPPGVPATVLDFRRNSNVPNYLGSSQQRRWLVLLAVGGVLAILLFRSDGIIPWLLPMPPDDRLNATHQRPERGEPDADAGPPTTAARGAFFPGVRQDYLSEVRDDEVFRTAESDAWFHLLAILKKTDESDLDRASIGRVGHLQLDQQAESYRGRLVSVGGVVRSARLVAAPANDFEIEEYYQLWLQPDRGSPKLIVLYALQLPDRFEIGADLDEPCQATGFFFKRWAYPSREGVTTAPLILARSIDWRRPPAVPRPEAPAGEQVFLAVVAALALAVLIVGYFVVRTRGAARPRRLADSREVEAAMRAHQSPLAGERPNSDSGED
jgi:hypothetical protein